MIISLDLKRQSTLNIVPVIWYIGAAIISAIVGVIYAFSDDGEEIVLLGPRNSGKTTFLDLLKGLPNIKPGSTVNAEEVTNLKYCVDGKEIEIKVITDTPGTKGYLENYRQLAEKAKAKVLFMFNIHDYLNDHDYAKNTNSRADLIFKLFKKQHDEGNVHVVITHIDELNAKDRSNLENILHNVFDPKEYRSLFSNKKLVNLLDKKDFKDLMSKVFLKK